MLQDIYQKAIKFAGEKHQNQKVPGTNANYLLHISNVAMEILIAYQANENFNVEYAVQLALLHDTIEDTDTDYKEIAQIFGEKIAKGVQALTKDENLGSKASKMKDSLSRINQLEKEVGMVKIADRITNLQKPPGHWTHEKIQNYLDEAIIINETLHYMNRYLNNRLDTKIEQYQKYLSE